MGDNPPVSTVSSGFASYGSYGRCLSCSAGAMEEVGRCVSYVDCFKNDPVLTKCRMQSQGCQDERRQAPYCQCEVGLYDKEGECLHCLPGCKECVDGTQCASCF